MNQLDRNYRERDQMQTISSSGQDEKISDKIDETEILRTFIEQLKKVIDAFPNQNKHISNMIRGQTEYFMYDIAEIHTILEDALRPVFRIDRTEKKKQKILRKNKGCFDNLDDIKVNPMDDNGKPAGMSSESDDEDDLLE